MKVTLKHAVRIKRGKEHVTLEPGTTADLPKETAEELIERGAAEAATAPGPSEEEPGAEPGR
ncbi:MAG: hypothetical protein ACE5FN_12600 [Leptospirillia bacterium]